MPIQPKFYQNFAKKWQLGGPAGPREAECDALHACTEAVEPALDLLLVRAFPSDPGCLLSVCAPSSAREKNVQTPRNTPRPRFAFAFISSVLAGTAGALAVARLLPRRPAAEEGLAGGPRAF